MLRYRVQGGALHERHVAHGPVPLGPLKGAVWLP